MTDSQPTDRDRENARIRQEIADRQAQEYEQVQAWAEAAFGPGWRPSHRHFLVDHLCGRPRKISYVAQLLMWPRGENRLGSRTTGKLNAT